MDTIYKDKCKEGIIRDIATGFGFIANAIW